MSDEDHGLPLVTEGPEDAEEVVGLLGGEDGGGLVQDQDLGAPVEGLEDLDALAGAHAEVGHPGVEVHLQVVLAAQALEAGPGPGQPVPEPEASLDPQDDVLQDGERLHQHEVLVDHADTGGQGGLRAAHGHRPTLDEDRAPIRAMVAVEDPHEGGLAGAVLADDPVDGGPMDGQRHVAVGVDRPEPLVDPS